MINTSEQEELLKLIANFMKTDIEAVAIGGTAMMFSNYKNATKDIDIVFKDVEDRDVFIDAIKQLGYIEKSLSDIYDEKRQQNPAKPLMFSRSDERFDLFVSSVFGFKINFSQDAVLQKYDFLGKSRLTLNVPVKEVLILLKAITGRETDFEDIVTILKAENNVSWDSITKQAIGYKESLPWILIDLEECMQKLGKLFDIDDTYFKRLYDAHGD